MGKIEIMDFLRAAKKKENQTENLFSEKYAEFLRAEERVKESLCNLMEKLFPEEVEKLLREYAELTGGAVTCENITIRVRRTEMRIFWFPNTSTPSSHETGCCITKTSNGHIFFFMTGKGYSDREPERILMGSCLDQKPEDEDELRKARGILRKFKAFGDDLENSIGYIYNELVLWKEEKAPAGKETGESFG